MMSESINKTHPSLAKEWADDKDVFTITHGSSYNARWKCKEGHFFNASVRNRSRGTGCPYCSGRKPVPGFNDLGTTHPHLISEWADERSIEEFGKGSHHKAKWLCPEKKHIYESTIYNKTKGTGCPYCSGNKVLQGFNDLATTHPRVIDEWNDDRDPSSFSAGSEVLIEWKCPQNHIYKRGIRDRTKGYGCFYCDNGRKVLPGFNDLGTTHPHLISEWADERSIEEFGKGSEYFANWQCKNGHIYSSRVERRARGENCHYCSGHKVLPGFNDLGTTHPHLISEWADERSIEEFGKGSNYKAKWLCANKGHKWISRIYSRTGSCESNCPECWATSFVSKAEQEVYEFIKSVLPSGTEVQQSNRSLIGKEIDIYIPTFNLAIEFNGVFWHTERQGKDRWYHYSKYSKCREKNVQLISIWEDNWRDSKSSVKGLLEHKLGVSKSGRTYARNTAFTDLSNEEGTAFLNTHHLQRGNKSAKHYGLRENSTGELVSVMSVRFSSKKKELEIKRFSASKVIPGGFSKLLKNVIDVHKAEQGEMAATKVVSYSHNDHSWGEVYRKNGFTKIHDGSPGYFYLRNSRREFRLNYSPKRFKERDDLIFEEGKTERELADLNGLERIWDCGSARWEREM